MFIAVPQYKNVRNDSVLIFDSEDCTVEHVMKTELTKALVGELEIKNYVQDVDMPYIRYMSILGLLGSNGTGVTYNSGILHIPNRADISIIRNPGILRVNNKTCTRRANSVIRYFFLFKDYVVFRCSYCNRSNYGLFTVFVDKAGNVEAYEEENRYKVKNKQLLMQLELLGGDL